MQTFDYIQAWYATAKPAYEEIMQHAAIRSLFDIVLSRPDLTQDRDLNVPIPSSEFTTIAAGIDTLTLAHAASAIHCYGHWSPLGHSRLDHGAHWKFSNIVDQIISTRLGLKPQHQMVESGIGFRCIEGVIRICVATQNSWTGQEITYADETAISAVRAKGKPVMTGNPRYHKTMHDYADRCEVYMEKLKSELAPAPGIWSDLINTARYMFDESTFMHLVCVAPDGTEKSPLCGLSASLDISLQLLSDKGLPPVCAVRLIGTYQEGKPWKGPHSVIYGDVVGHPELHTPDAIDKAHEYRALAEIRKAQSIIVEQSAKLADLETGKRS